jgi:hypothetical protein
MILELPLVFQGIGYFEGVSLILWIIGICLLFISSFLFLLKALKIELKEPKTGFFAYCIFCSVFALGRIAFTIGNITPASYDFFTSIGYILAPLSIVPLLYVLETQIVTNTKKIFLIITIIGISIALISLIFPDARYFALTMLTILMPFSTVSMIILYIYVIIKTSGTVRKKAFLILFGLALIGISQVIDSEYFVRAVPLELPPICLTVGTVIFTISQLMIKVH